MNSKQSKADPKMKNLPIVWLANRMISQCEYEIIYLHLSNQLSLTQQRNQHLWLARLTLFSGASLTIAAII